MISHRMTRTTTSALLFLALAHHALAQVSSASLSGVVMDESKGVLPGATISAMERASGRQYVATADERGEYRLVNVVPGTYKIRVQLSGFATYRDLATVPRIYGRTVTNRSGTSKG